MPNDNRPDGRSPPGRHQSESMAGFERSQGADITRNARPTSAEYARTTFCPANSGPGSATSSATANHLRFHESIASPTPADVYFGRKKTILLERERIKRRTV
jgi:hypothetical protein